MSSTVLSMPVVHPLVGDEMGQLVDFLASKNLPVEADADRCGCVHIHAGRPMSTLEEVTVLRLFALRTDARLIWHQYQEATP